MVVEVESVSVVQCIFLAPVTAAVSCLVETCHSTQRGSRLWTRLLGHLPGGFPLPVLPPAEVSAPDVGCCVIISWLKVTFLSCIYLICIGTYQCKNIYICLYTC